MKKETSLIIGIIVLLILGLLLFINFRTANVVVSDQAFPDSFRVGERLSGDFIINLEEGDSISADTPIFISLSDSDGKTVVTETLTFEEFVLLSGNDAKPVEKNGGKYYEEVGKYRVSLDKIVDYQFEKKGEYELFINIFKLDLNFNKEIIVK